MNWKALILAIAMVESGNDPDAIGKHGEVSHLQISDIMRRDYIRVHNPVHKITMAELSKSPETAEFIFKTMIEHYGADISVTHAALFWQHGAGYMQKQKKNIDYARRVNALYVEYDKQQAEEQEQGE
jgi:hypothetical protein